MATTLASTKKKKWYQVLYIQVLVGIAVGLLIGVIEPVWGVELKILSDVFIKLIKIIIAPVIFCTVVIGIASMSDVKYMGRTGGIALIYFEVMTTLALILGLLVMNIFPIGTGMQLSTSVQDANTAIQFANQSTSFKDYLLNIIPKSFMSAFTDNDTLQVLLLAILFGLSLQRLGGKNHQVYQFIHQTSEIFFDMVGRIMNLAPWGAMGSIAYTIGKYGIASLYDLLLFVGMVYLVNIFFIIFCLGTVAHYTGFSIFKFIKYIKEEILIVLGTCSSETVLPRMIQKLEKLGVKKDCVSLVLPTGYSFNLDGTCLYFTMSALFLAHVTGVPLSLFDQLSLLGVLLISSKGATAIYGSAFIILGSTLTTTPIPIASMAILLSVDRFMAEARATTNLIGNGVATLFVSQRVGDLDKEQLERELNA